MTAEPDRWFVRFAPRPAASVRLICFPFFGAGATYYRPWVSRLPPEAELTSVRLPGREGRSAEIAQTDLPRLAGMLARLLVTGADRRPTIFFGHSAGGVLAVETCHAGQRLGNRPALLAVSATPPPDHPFWTAGIRTVMADPMPTYLAIGGQPSDAIQADRTLAEAFALSLRSDTALYAGYQGPPGPLDCPLTVLGGDADPLVDPAALAGWARWSTGPTTRRTYPGDHFYLREHPQQVIDDLFADYRALAPPPA